MTGDPFTAEHRHWRNIKAVVGAYSAGVGGGNAQSAVECPYCNEPMQVLVHQTTPPCRIVSVVETHATYTAVIGQSVPPTHRVFSCRNCLQVFTLPASELFVESAVDS